MRFIAYLAICAAIIFCTAASRLVVTYGEEAALFRELLFYVALVGVLLWELLACARKEKPHAATLTRVFALAYLIGFIRVTIFWYEYPPWQGANITGSIKDILTHASYAVPWGIFGLALSTP